MSYNTIAIVGPIGSGVKETAIEIAKERDGGLICCDVLQLYKGFNIGTGMFQNPDQELVPSRLYGELTAEKRYLPSEMYGPLAADARQSLIDEEKIPIFEGCSSNLAKVLLEDDYMQEKRDIAVFGLFPNSGNIGEKLHEDIEQMLYKGLYREIKNLISEGMSRSFPMRGGIVYRAFAPYVRGQRTEEEARDIALSRFEETIEKQREVFEQMEGIIPIEVDVDDISGIVDMIQKKLDDLAA